MNGSDIATRSLDGVLDRSIFFSFDRSGFERHRRAFREEDLDVDMTGKVCLVTGANSGLGKVLAVELARRTATVWMLCRSPDRGRKACADVRRETGNREVHLAVVDVADQRSVSEFAKSFRNPRVDVLVHNAGVLNSERTETDDGIETTLATHVIGPFLLTWLLTDRLGRSEDARVIWVSSGGMYGASLNFPDPQWANRDFDGVRAYAEAKRAQVVLNETLAPRFTSLGISLYAMHPGWADTPGVQHSLPRFWWWMKGRLRTPAQGADCAVWLSVSEQLKGKTGLFWFDRRPVPTHLVPWTRESDEDRRRLLELCEELTRIGGREEQVA